MNALFITLFVSLILAGLGVLLFMHGVAQKDHEHADRLSILPLDDDAGPPVATGEGSPHGR